MALARKPLGLGLDFTIGNEVLPPIKDHDFEALFYLIGHLNFEELGNWLLHKVKFPSPTLVRMERRQEQFRYVTGEDLEKAFSLTIKEREEDDEEVRDDYFQILRWFLEKAHLNPNYVNKSGNPLLTAIKLGDMELVQLLTEFGASLDYSLSLAPGMRVADLTDNDEIVDMLEPLSDSEAYSAAGDFLDESEVTDADIALEFLKLANMLPPEKLVEARPISPIFAEAVERTLFGGNRKRKLDAVSPKAALLPIQHPRSP